MRPSEVKDVLRTSVRTKRPVFLEGPPGIGKSSVCRQVAAECGMEYVDFRALLYGPTDLQFPWPKDGHVEFLYPSWLPTDPAAKVFICIDELPAAPPATMLSLLQLILDRKLGSYTLPEGCYICAAGNRVEDKTGARRLMSAVASRFRAVSMDADLDDWCDWAWSNGVRPEIIAYHRWSRGSHLFVWDPNVMTKPLCPRDWPEVSKTMDDNPANGAFLHSIAGDVGEGEALEFSSWMAVYKELPSMKEVFSSPQTAKVPADSSACFAVVMAMVRSTDNKDRFAAGASYLRRFDVSVQGEFTALYVCDVVKVAPKLLNTETYSTWARENTKSMIR